MTLEQGGDDIGVLLDERRTADDVRGHELALGPQALLVDEHLSALCDVLRHPGLGHPGTVDVAGHEGGQSLGVGLRRDGHVAATLGRGLDARLLEPVAERDVLGVAQLRRSEGLALHLLHAGDPGANDE